MSVLDSVLQLRTAGVWKTGHKKAKTTYSVLFQLSTCIGLPRIQEQISICIAKPKRWTLNNITSSFVYFCVIQQFRNGLFTNKIAFLCLVQLFLVSCSIRSLRVPTPSQGFKVASISPNTSPNNWFTTRLPDQLSLGKPQVGSTRITKS